MTFVDDSVLLVDGKQPFQNPPGASMLKISSL